MQVSKRRLNKNVEKQIYAMLYQLVSDIKTPDEAAVMLRDLLSETEKQVIAKRLAIAMFLEKGRSYENIKTTLKVSSATIANVQESMGSPGMELALGKVRAEEWAEEWAGKITSFVGKILPGNK